jgi:phosphoesterase RecJ-like protein
VAGVTHEGFSDIDRAARAIRAEIKSSKRPVVLTHARVDADAVGSVVAMAALCRACEVAPAAERAGDADMPANLRFLDLDGLMTQTDLQSIDDADLVIFVDCADDNRSGPLSARLKARATPYRIINIDHHVTNTRYGDVNLVIPYAAATCEILLAVFESLELEVNGPLATALLAGIYGDTLGLKTPNTTPHTMRACARLFEDGAYLDLIVDQLFRKKPFSTVILWGEVQSRAAWRGRLVWSIVTGDMLERAGAATSETEGLVNFLAGVEGAFAATLVQESHDGWRVSLRSTTEAVDVSDLAGLFGGGGHPRAAGCRLDPGRDAVELFLDTIAGELDKLPEDAGTRPADARLVG